jgi:hypothetical protein
MINQLCHILCKFLPNNSPSHSTNSNSILRTAESTSNKEAIFYKIHLKRLEVLVSQRVASIFVFAMVKVKAYCRIALHSGQVEIIKELNRMRR